jgi:hypothetical protein
VSEEEEEEESGVEETESSSGSSSEDSDSDEGKQLIAVVFLVSYIHIMRLSIVYRYFS